MTDYNFDCEHCGERVPWATFQGEDKPRDHCPYCLWSKHVIMGANIGKPPCNAMMRGVAVGDGNEIVLRCLGCRFSYRRFTDDYMMGALGNGFTKGVEMTFHRDLFDVANWVNNDGSN